MDHFRPRNAKTDHVFVTWTGSPLTSSGVAGALTSELAAAGIEKKYVSHYLLKT
jgi:site-specific recombinase XerD